MVVDEVCVAAHETRLLRLAIHDEPEAVFALPHKLQQTGVLVQGAACRERVELGDDVVGSDTRTVAVLDDLVTRHRRAREDACLHVSVQRRRGTRSGGCGGGCGGGVGSGVGAGGEKE